MYNLDEATARYIDENYYTEEGKLFRKTGYKQWDKGTEVGRYVGKNGYKTPNSSSILGRRYPVHRIVYFIVHGYLPAMIDHIDGDKTNNSPENLRQKI